MTGFYWTELRDARVRKTLMLLLQEGKPTVLWFEHLVDQAQWLRLSPSPNYVMVPVWNSCAACGLRQWSSGRGGG